jgi:transposase
MERQTSPYDSLSRDQLIDLVVELEAQNRAQAARITALEEQVRRLLERLGPPTTPDNSSLPPSRGRKANLPEREAKQRPRRPMFHRRALHPNPDETMDCRLAVCRHCGSAELIPGGIESYDHHELVEKPIKVTRVNLHACTCGRCGRRTVAAPPAGLGQLIGEHLRAFTVLLRHYTDVPYGRLRTMLDEVFGIRLSQGYLVASIGDAAADLAPAAQAIREAVKASPVVMSDETGLRVDGRNAWVWVFRTPWDILFLIDRRRSRAVAEELLAEAGPTCWVSDRCPAQAGLAAERQVCLAHLLRDCRRAEELGDAAFAPTLRQVLLDIMDHDRHKAEWAASTLAQRRGEIDRKLDDVVAIEPLHPKGTTLRRWVKGHRYELTLCLRNLDVPATNNASERALRPFVTARKVFGCARSKEGADAMAVIRSLLMTARARGLPVMQAIATALVGGILPNGNRLATA